ncbi:hypothetical protein LY632_09555 [Erythrobacter sp. SDW2]|uniref:hypothetical protein n=1 Tax=Erythrobacter sp. SDW2 TaxID=2907154 RepID=UPI001F1D1897|nr:hypothetical protein [Erythrobacter sp. SDW2]UIP05948.1 hypothetical protein LY632_09555 [Erythrobacter sp. SDW2]
MEGERIETAVQRIEQALARISAIADKGPPTVPPMQGAPAAVPPNVLQLVTRHETLREAVLAELERLDEIIGKLEG